MTTDAMLCPDCMQPFGIGSNHPCTMSDEELRRFVLDWLGHGWTGKAIHDAATLDEAIALARENYGECWAGRYGPHTPAVDCRPNGVTYQRDLFTGDTRQYRLTWRQVAEELRRPVRQLALFALAG